MKLYYGGGEIPAWSKLLKEQGISTVAVSYVGLKRRKESFHPDEFSKMGDVFLDSGGYTYNKEESKYDFSDALETAAQYMDYVRAAIGNISLVSEFDAVQLGAEYISKFREDFYNTLPPDKFMPIWHPQDGNDELERLCSMHRVVGVSQSDIHGDTERVGHFNSFIRRYDVRLHGVGITSKKLIEAVKWDSVSSTSWLSPSMYGDTFVWTGRELKRYPKDYKDRRKTHRTLLIDNGFDYDKIIADDSQELLRLSLWSWQEYVSYINGVTAVNRNRNTKTGEKADSAVDTQGEKTGTNVAIPRSHEPLPIMQNIFRDTQDEDGFSESAPLLNIRSESMRVCDTCFLSSKCPGFQANSTCLYNIPIEIRTKDQLRSLHDALLEMQTQRVMFMKMAEDISGGYVDANLSSEIDRLNRMIKAKQDAEKSTFSATLNISETPSGPTFMQRMLGSGAVDKLRQLDTPVMADEIIEAEIVD